MASSTEALVTGEQRIAAAFESARTQGRAALMPYMMGGFPDSSASLAIADAYAEGGADLIELGVPFSDPLADGPVIHAAATRALDAGSTLASVLDVCRSVSDRVPVVLMVYANMVLARGPDEFASAAAKRRRRRRDRPRPHARGGRRDPRSAEPARARPGARSSPRPPPRSAAG